MISGLRRTVNHIFALLGGLATLAGSKLPTFWEILLVPSPRVNAVLDRLTHEYETNSLSRNVGKQVSTTL